MAIKASLRYLKEGAKCLKRVTFDGNDTIHIRSWGDVTLNDLLESTRLTEELHRKHGVRKVLIDALELIVFLRIGDSFDLAEELSRQEMPAKMKIAVAISPVAKERGKFFQSALINRGINLHLFDTLEKAREWLGEDDE